MAISADAPPRVDTPVRAHGAPSLRSIPLAWRLRAGALVAILGVVLVALLVNALQSSPAAQVVPVAPQVAQVEPAAPAPPVAPAPALTPGQLTSALRRTALAPNAVNLELTYAPPVFFQVTGKDMPKDAALVFYLQEDTHIDALDPVPPRFTVSLDGAGEYVASSGSVLSDSGHHRTSSFVFTQADLPVAKKDMTAVFHFANGTTANAQWVLPLQLPDGSAINTTAATAAASMSAAGTTAAENTTTVAAASTTPDNATLAAADPLSSSELVSLNATLRRVQKDVVYAGASVAEVDLTYATPEYFKAALSPEAARRLTPETNAVFMVSETNHTADLPASTMPLSLIYQGTTYTPDLVESTVASSHHRVTMVRFPFDPNQNKFLGRLDVQMPDGSMVSWGLPVIYTKASSASPIGLTLPSILSLVGGMLAAMWPCLFQLTVFFIPALAGVSMEEASSAKTGVRHRFRVIKAALFFILGFTIVYTAAGALVGFAVQQFGNAPNFDTWQRYIGIAAGLAIIVLALRTAAKVRAPIVCKMPVLSRMAHGRSKASSPLELMVAGLAFATGCMTCFGAALIIAMVVYVGMAGSAWVGALTLFLFSMGMGVPLVIAASAMGKVLPMLTKLERITPWMGLASSLIMIGFAVMLMTGNYMAFTNWLLERI